MITEYRLKLNDFFYHENQRKRQTRLLLLAIINLYILMFSFNPIGDTLEINPEITLPLSFFIPTVFTIFLFFKWKLLNRKYKLYPLAWLYFLICSLFSFGTVFIYVVLIDWKYVFSQIF